MEPAVFQRSLLAWYQKAGRRDLPWKNPVDPYRIWVSEIMLQQTQVATVIPYFQRFMARFPSVEVLAEAKLDEVLALWSGLGYYARARHLHAAARQVMTEHGGELPRDLEALQALPGIGRSTAGAILAQAHGQPHPILDGNAKRVLARFHAVEGWPGQAAVNRQLWALAERYTPRERVADYTQAIMDLGATVCTRHNPRCLDCPIREGCRAFAEGWPEAYPSPRPRRELPRRTTRWLVVQDDQERILLARKPPSGVWGGLWTPPEAPEGVDLQQWAAQKLGLTLHPLRPGTHLEHTFSHFRLHIEPWHARVKGQNPEIMEPSETVWYNETHQESLGLPAPVQTLLQNMRGE